jgi:HEAT repeat protein
LALALAAALAVACVGGDDNRLEVLVDALVAESGTLSTQAQAELVARGRESIVILETGLYRGTPAGRRRIITTLSRIGHADVRPILEHLKAYDPEPEVREHAARALQRLNTPGRGQSK